MRERKFVKVRVDMYDDTKFKIIDRMPKRDLIHYVWSRIVVLAGKVNQEGELYMSRNISYTVETLAIEFNRDIDEIKTALDVLVQLEMIEFTEDKIYKVKNFVKHQNIKAKEKVEIKKKESEINYSESNRTENYTTQDNITENPKEMAGSLKNEISVISTEEKEKAHIKADKYDEISVLDLSEINSDMKDKFDGENECNNEKKYDCENRCDNESNLNQQKSEKNNIKQHNNSPVIFEIEKNQRADKKNKKNKKKKIRDDIIEIGKDEDIAEFSEDNVLMNVEGEEKEEDSFCWITDEEMKLKEGEKVLLEMSF
jgi:predicted phage replisome organizer